MDYGYDFKSVVAKGNGLENSGRLDMVPKVKREIRKAQKESV